MYGGKFTFQNRLGYLAVERKFTIFALFYFVFGGKFQLQAARGAYIRRGELTEGFCVTILGFYIWRGLYMEGLIFGILRYLLRSKFFQEKCLVIFICGNLFLRITVIIANITKK